MSEPYTIMEITRMIERFEDMVQDIRYWAKYLPEEEVETRRLNITMILHQVIPPLDRLYTELESISERHHETTENDGQRKLI